MSVLEMEKAVVSSLSRLSPAQQREVLNYAEFLAQKPLPKGTPGEEFVRLLAGKIPKEEVELMEKAIEEDCGQVNPDDWK
jgi:hypothetical protein